MELKVGMKVKLKKQQNGWLTWYEKMQKYAGKEVIVRINDKEDRTFKIEENDCWYTYDDIEEIIDNVEEVSTKEDDLQQRINTAIDHINNSKYTIDKYEKKLLISILKGESK